MLSNLLPAGASMAQVTQVATIATHTLSPLWSWASGVLILLILMGILVVIPRYMGRGPFVAFIAALYIAYALYATFPYMDVLPTAPAITALAGRVALYFIFLVPAYLVLRRISASDFIHLGSVGLLVISFCTAAFIMVLAYQIFPVRSVYQFTPALDHLFAAREWFFWWFAAPLAGLFLFAH